MPSYRLTLRYPNGRAYECVEASESSISIGTEFERFGRRWRIVRQSPLPARHREGWFLEPEAFDCQPADAAGMPQ